MSSKCILIPEFVDIYTRKQAFFSEQNLKHCTTRPESEAQLSVVSLISSDDQMTLVRSVRREVREVCEVREAWGPWGVRSVRSVRSVRREVREAWGLWGVSGARLLRREVREAWGLWGLWGPWGVRSVRREVREAWGPWGVRSVRRLRSPSPEAWASVVRKRKLRSAHVQTHTTNIFRLLTYLLTRRLHNYTLIQNHTTLLLTETPQITNISSLLLSNTVCATIRH